jgi:hypothetical protein
LYSGRTSTLPYLAIGMSPGDAQGLVEVARLDEDEAAKNLAGLGERAVGHGDLAAAVADGGGGADRLQGGGDHVIAAALERLVIGAGVAVELGPLGRRQALQDVRLEIDEAEILHRDSLRSGRPARTQVVP